MKRVRLTIAYDGTNYCGWQSQNNAVAVQDVLNHHLSELLGEKIETIGASRTDAGVHAYGNVAVFDTNHRMPAEKISYALNARLPEDIRIQKSEEVPEDFHPRYCSSIKTYEYKILNRHMMIPTLRNYANFVYVPLDVKRMRDGAKYIVGEHDFKSFCGAGAQVKTTVREVLSVELFTESLGWKKAIAMNDITAKSDNSEKVSNPKEMKASQENQDKLAGDTTSSKRNEKDMQSGELITLRIRGRGFLYNMVRIIAGTLMEVGRGKYEPEHVAEIIAACDREAAGPTAPARGLTLVGIQYQE